MEAIKSFVEKFCSFEIQNVHKTGRRFYQISKELLECKKSINRDFFYIGTFLGETKKEFVPSLALLEMIAKKTSKKVFVNKKGEWLFTCKRDVFEENIVKKNVEKGVCLVQNEKDENLGYGLLQKKRSLMLKPLLDKGDYLRRER